MYDPPVIPFIICRTFTPAINAKRLRLLSRMVPCLMVHAWIEIHKELMVDWELAVNGEEPFRIAPLQ